MINLPPSSSAANGTVVKCPHTADHPHEFSSFTTITAACAVMETTNMPTTVEHLQKRFKLVIVDGLPQATIEMNGGVHWVMCCPLCGCSHQLLGVDERLPYTPLCQIQPLLFKAELAVWVKQYPEVSKYSSLHLIEKVA